MKNVKGLETAIQKVFKDLPHLPKSSKKLLADYAWVLTIIAVVLGVFALYNAWRALELLQAADVFLNVAAAWGASAGGYGMVKVYLYVSLLAALAVTALMAMAIVPLKEKKHKGWMMSFYALLVGAALELIGLVFNFGAFFNVFSYLVGITIGLYLLFEIREYFVPSAKPKAAASSAKK